MKNLILTFLILISIFRINAQEFQIKGQITDKSSHSLPGAGISLLQLPDSILLSGTVSDTNGIFILKNLYPGKILLKISFLGFNDLFLNKEISGKSLDLGSIFLQDNVSTLNEVNVTEKMPPVQAKGDTTQYNADAFKTNKDASAEDLALKMPGIITQDGKVQAQGEEVKKVLIDGKPYLGDDPNAALKNLPAEVIDKIQIFDKKSDQSEFTGFNDGNTTKTMNIITRSQFRNGTFGRVYGGYGTDEHWKGGMSINFFKEKRKLTILGNTNNINEQNFSSDDLLGVLSSSGGNRTPQRGNFGSRPGGTSGGRYQPQNEAGSFLVDPKNGITTTHSAGINYVNSWKKTDFSFSYFFNHSDNRSASDLFRQYLTSDNYGLVYQENNVGKNENINHRANVRLEYKFDTLNSVLLQPRISFQKNSGNSLLSGNNTNSGTPLSDVNSYYNTDLDGLSFSAPLLYRHSFNKKGRTFSANLVTGYNQNKGSNDLNSVSVFYYDTIPNDTMNQISDLNSHTWNYSSELIYTEPVKTKGLLSFSYKGNYSKSVSDKSTYTYSPADLFNTLDTGLSNKFNSDNPIHSVGTNYRYTTDKWNMMAGIAYQVAQIKNEQIFPDAGSLNKKYYSVLPNAMFQYTFTPKKNLRVYYRSSNNSPSISQLQNVINNTNPLQLTTGNPELKQDWQNYLNVRYSAVNSEKNTSFFIFVSGTYTNDFIGNSTYIAKSDTVISDNIILASGSQISMPVNVDGYFSIRSFGNYSFPLGILKSSLNLNANANYSRTPGLINGTLTYSTSTGSGLGFALSSNVSEKLDFLLSSNGIFSNIKSSSQENSNNNSFNLFSRFKIQVMPWKGLVLQTDLTYQYNSGLSESYNQNYTLWNAAIGYKFLKNNSGELRLSVFDLLKQNTNVSRNTTDIYYEDVQTNVLQQYFMLTFTYNLKFFKVAKEKQLKSEN